ncbi:GNAT family N-acetyltransferase [Nocardioides bigeumensis]|uniref:N-acetyltransferase domain-containing protein n=1 Tax=Nocardioides bigeumensis TaxID=433657 RepID=A0ABP5J9A0_9ACTN
MEELSIAEGLPRMQALASRLWRPKSRHHPGQLAWSTAYAVPEELDHGPVAFVIADGVDIGWAWQEEPGWVELCLDADHPDSHAAGRELVAWAAGADQVATSVLETESHLIEPLRAAGFVADWETPWFTHHHADLASLAEPSPAAGYTLRHVRPDEADARSACHRGAWSPTSKVSEAAYSRLMATPPYRHELDWVAVDEDDRMVASCLVWYDAGSGAALVEPVGCAPNHRRQGLAGAVSLAALQAARRLGATTGLVCPRGDDGYPVPARVYRGIGFEPGHRTVTLQRTVPGGG